MAARAAGRPGSWMIGVMGMLRCWARRFGSFGRLRWGRWFGTAGGAVVAGLCFSASAGAATIATASFTTPGQYSFTVPVGVTSVALTAVGAAGGASQGTDVGGRGASAGGLSAGSPAPVTVPVTAGEQLSVVVGGIGTRPTGGPGGAGGFGGGGAGGSGSNGAGGGGGASLVAAGRAVPRVVAGCRRWRWRRGLWRKRWRRRFGGQRARSLQPRRCG